MNLKILLPFGVFATLSGVTSLVAQTREGAFGVLPHRLDCVAALAPGILSYTADNRLVYLAADEGVLIKQGTDVMVAVRHCIQGSTLAALHDAVTQQFLARDATDQAIRRALTQMESGLMGRLAELRRGR